jgi:hypothetical protein
MCTWLQQFRAAEKYDNTRDPRTESADECEVQDRAGIHRWPPEEERYDETISPYIECRGILIHTHRARLSFSQLQPSHCSTPPPGFEPGSPWPFLKNWDSLALLRGLLKVVLKFSHGSTSEGTLVVTHRENEKLFVIHCQRRIQSQRSSHYLWSSLNCQQTTQWPENCAFKQQTNWRVQTLFCV